jgi:hypothetical protein
MVPHFRDELYRDVKTPGYKLLGHIIRGLNLRGHNVGGRIVPVPPFTLGGGGTSTWRSLDN